MSVKDINSKSLTRFPSVWLNQFSEGNHGRGLGKQTFSMGCGCSLGA